MKTMIKWAATSLARMWEKGKVPIQQVTYLSKAAMVSTWTPYGVDSSPPPDKLALLFSVLGNSDNQVAFIGSPGEGPELEGVEVVYYHPPTGSKLHFRNDGSVEIVSGSTSVVLFPAGGMLLKPGSVPATVDGDLIVTGSILSGSATVTGATTLGAVVTSAGKNIGSTHAHVGSPTAPVGPQTPTGTPV